MKPGKEGHLTVAFCFYRYINHFAALPRQRLAMIILVLSAVGTENRFPQRLYSGGEKQQKQ
ncbi:hypothetical protein LNO19_06585 [Klebsiella quasipneumoniae subsp. similipneumoniae]|nr:hypothetical protein [Klebsiella quasipneumoniae subsp. similipneumoniae]